MNKSKLNLQNPTIRNPLIALAVALALGYLWYSQSYKEAQATLQNKLTTKEQKESELRTILALRPQLETLRAEKVNAEKRLDSLRAIFPDHRQVPRLVRDLSSVARASSIVTTKFNPIPEVEQEFHIENRYNVAVSGMYHSLGEFYAYLANFPLIINLSNVIISANPGYRDAMERDEYDMFSSSVMATFQLTTFSSKR